MTDGVVATKLFRPGRRRAVVARGRLADRLGDVADPGRVLTLVSAPAGFGKTTLVAEWTADLARTAWLSLDEADNAPARFLAHLWAAVGDPDLDPPPDDPSAAAGALVAALARARDRRVLVLDDYHVVETPVIHEAMTLLLEHAPDTLHVVVVTRADPPFPLARLRARDRLTEVRAADLRFTLPEAREFLADVMGLDLPDGDVAALEDRTEGWAAGLQLAALSLRDIPDRADAAAFVADLSGSHRFVLDFLVDEVVARLDTATRDFLLRTAVLERLTGPLCDAVTGGADGAERLVDLDRRNVFVVPLDGERRWYRYHHLFRDVLRARLLAECPEQVPALHRAASDACAAHDLVEDAVRHALAAGEDERAAHLMETALPAMRRARRDDVLLAWMRSLPDAVVRRRPVLAITSAWSRLMAGDLDGADRRLDDADAALAAGPGERPWAGTEDLRTAPATVPVYRAALAQARGDVAGTVHHARHAWELAGPDDHVVRGAAGGFLGLAAWAAGDVEEALATFSAAVRSLHAAGNLVDELDATIVLADMWVTAGRPHRARRLLADALETATRPFPRAVPDLHVSLAELDRERDDLAAAEEHLATARTLAERGSITENRHRWFVAAAHVRAAAGGYDEADRLLAEAAALHRPGFYPDVRPIPAQRARLRLRAGDVGSAQEWARGIAVDAVSFLHEYEHLTLVRLLMVRGGLDEAEALLDRLQADAAPGRAASLLEIGVLRALVVDARGDRAAARAALDRAVAEAPEPEAWVRLFRDEGAPMQALLGAAPADPLPDPLPDPLSAREREVLRLLDGELTGPEIARRLFVSVNTLRTHTKRIFTKLDVGTRAAAVRRARELGLL